MHTELRQYIGHAQCFYCSKRYIFGLARSFFITARKRSLGQGNIFTSVCHSVHRRGVRARGGVHVGVCVHAWGTCVVGGVHARGCACLGGAWQGACVVGVCMAREKGSVRGRKDGHCSGVYASNWNAFLFVYDFSTAVNLC